MTSEGLAPIRIDTKGLQKLVRNLKKASNPKTVEAILWLTARKVAATMESRVSEYPEQRTGEAAALPAVYTLTNAKGETYQSKFKSLKQQRWFFKSLKDKKIRVPYVRGRGKSEQLGASITTKITKSGHVWTIRIGTDVSYAIYVIGDPPDQSAYHAGHWTPLSEDVTSPDAISAYAVVAEKTVSDGLNAVLGGYTL